VGRRALGEGASRHRRGHDPEPRESGSGRTRRARGLRPPGRRGSLSSSGPACVRTPTKDFRFSPRASRA
jgi:hypothetical protein